VLNSIYHERPEYPGLQLEPHSGDGETPPDDRPDNLRRLGLDGH